jgi:Uma2 family endonuclease
MTTTALRLGPADAGRRLSLEEFTTASFAEGHKYELIDGRLTVAPAADLIHNELEDWVGDWLREYARERPEVINKVTGKSRVFVPDRPEVTIPEPDLAAYHDFPTGGPISGLRWEDYSPILVVEVLSPDSPRKDLERNVELYRQVPSIREYWVVDQRPDPDRPSLRVYRRRGRGWRVIDVAFGETYETRLLPGFRLVIDPHHR